MQLWFRYDWQRALTGRTPSYPELLSSLDDLMAGVLPVQDAEDFRPWLEQDAVLREEAYRHASSIYRQKTSTDPFLYRPAVWEMPSPAMLAHPLFSGPRTASRRRLLWTDDDGSEAPDSAWNHFGVGYYGDFLYYDPHEFIRDVGLDYAILATDYLRARVVPLAIGAMLKEPSPCRTR